MTPREVSNEKDEMRRQQWANLAWRLKAFLEENVAQSRQTEGHDSPVAGLGLGNVSSLVAADRANIPTAGQIQELRAKAEDGSVEACETLTEYYWRSGDLEAAKIFAHLAAGAGDSRALVALADGLAARKTDVSASEEACLLYLEAVEIGSIKALVPLALFLEEGEHMDMDPKAAFRLIEQAREAGIPEAQYHAGRYYEAGAYAPQDYVLARELYLKAAGQGISEALVRLGLMAREGYLGEPDLVQAQAYLSEAMKLGDREAPRILARILGDSTFEGHDPYQAIELVIRSAELGSTAAKNEIARWVWKKQFGLGTDDPNVILNLLTEGAAESDVTAILTIGAVIESTDMDPLLADLAVEFKVGLFEEGRYRLAPGLAEYELTSGFLNPEEANALAVAYLEFAADAGENRSKQILKDYRSGKGKLIDLIQEISSLSYEQFAVRNTEEFEDGSGPPIPTRLVAPVYPPALRDLMIEGQAIVTFVVDDRGRVIDIGFLKTDHEAFRKPVVDALSSSEFEPARNRRGDALKTKVQLTFRFDPTVRPEK